jgi:hypothetical protein
MTSLYLKIKIATLEFEIAMLDAKILKRNSDGLKSNKVELENRLFVIKLYHSQVVNDIAEDLKPVFDKSGPAKLAADFLSLRKSALIAKAEKEPNNKSIQDLLQLISLELNLLRGSFGNSS